MKKHLLLLFISILFSASLSVNAQLWSSAGLSYPGLVFALTDYNGSVQAGGVFSTPEQIRTMAVYNGNLYSGGSNIGGITHVNANGFSFATISGGGPITSMAVFNNELYVGGLFDSINNIPVNNIAKYNGSTWSAVSIGVGGTPEFVYSLGVYNGALYAGTNFGSCYKWDGTSWSGAGTFTSTTGGALIRGFGVYNSELYAGGFFDHVNGSAMINLAKWNGTNWVGVGDIGIAGDPGNGLSALTEFNGELYCGGNFSIAGGATASCIARYNGGNWQALGSGTNGVVNALLVFNQSLYAAGSFTSAGGISVSNVARWYFCTPPSAIISYSGTPVLCNPGGNILLNANIGTGYTYQWKFGNSNISGATSSTYLVTAIGTYSVVVTNASGCSATSSAVGISANTVFANISPSGPISICVGSSALLTAYISGGYTYQWKNNGVAISGATSSTYNATTAGTYTVDETAGPCTKISNVVTVTVNSLPNAAITFSGAITFCSGGTVTLNATAGTNRAFQWKKNGVNISGATLPSFTTITGGSYKVTVINTLTGCSKTTVTPAIVTVNPLPLATATPQGPTTFCAGDSVILKANTGTLLTHQWIKNGSNIAGAMGKNYTAKTAGTYKVKVTNSNGCVKFSSGVIVTVPCREGENMKTGEGERKFDVTAFPNPSSGDFVFEIQNAAAEKISINVYDMIGKLILSESVQHSTFTIHNSQLVPEIYSAVITNGENKKVLKLVKTE